MFLVIDGWYAYLITILESLFADARHAVGDGDRCQTAAVIESPFADARHAAGDDCVLTADNKSIG